jgi:hypothetical protein
MKTKYLLVAAFLAIYLSSFSNCVSAQASPVTEKLSGRVVDMVEGKPLTGTQIWIHAAKWIHNPNGVGEYTVQQDSTGTFSIELPDGYYYVFIANLGCFPYAKEIWFEHGHPVKLMVKLVPEFEMMQDYHGQ